MLGNKVLKRGIALVAQRTAYDLLNLAVMDIDTRTKHNPAPYL